MARSPFIENWLDHQKVDWQYIAEMPIESIDKEKSLANQSRLGEKLDKNYVDRLIQAKIDQMLIPALIGHYEGSKIVLNDGNHRLDAAVAVGDKAIDVYLIKGDDSRGQERITRAANLPGSKGMPHEHVIEHAKWYVRDRGWAIKAAAAYWGLKEYVLKAALDVDAARLRMGELGVSEKKHSAAMMMRIADIPSNPVATEMEKLVSEARLTVEEASPHISKVRQARSDLDGIKMVKEWRKGYADRIGAIPPVGTKKPLRSLTPERKFMRGLRQVVWASEDLSDYIPGSDAMALIDAAIARLVRMRR